MRTSKAGIDLIRLSELFVSKPYLCPAGIPTIGYGTTMYPNGKKVTLRDKPITKDEAIKILEWQVDNVYEEYVDKYVKVPLTQGQYDALVDFVYNMGGGALATSTLLKKLNAKDYDGAHLEFDKWVMARDPKTGRKRPLRGLKIRRDMEQVLWNTLPWPVKNEA